MEVGTFLKNIIILYVTLKEQDLKWCVKNDCFLKLIIMGESEEKFVSAVDNEH